MNLKDVQNLIGDRIDSEKDNLVMMRGMDEMDQFVWSADPVLKTRAIGLEEVVSTRPHDAIKQAVALFSTMFPKPRITPLGQGTEKQIAEIERALEYFAKKALKRKGQRSQDTVLKHALLYGKVSILTMYMPWQEKAVKAFKGLKLKHAKRFGPYAILVRNPQNVFPFYNDILLEGVVSRETFRNKEFEDFWGKSTGQKPMEWVTVFDYWDHDQRIVWAIPTGDKDTPANPDDKKLIKLMNDDNELPFLPWTVVQQGDILQPFLYSIWKTGQWKDENMYSTMQRWEILQYFGSPRYLFSGPNPEDGIEIHYGEPGIPAYAKGDNKVDQLGAPQVDPNVSQKIYELQASQYGTTIPETVQTGEPGGDREAFASLTKRVELGIKNLNPFKELAETAFCDIYYNMLYWLDHTGDELYGYKDLLFGNSAEVKISTTLSDIDGNPYKIDVDQLDISVTLDPDLPIDEVAQLNKALMARQAGYSEYTSLEGSGVDDPIAERERRHKEEIEEAEHQLKIQQMQFEQQAEQQQQMMTIQAQAQAQAMAQQQGQAVLEQARNAGTGFENARSDVVGQGMNPAMGGTPPALINPAGTRETQQGRNK